MTHGRGPLEHALDLFVYGPIGAALTAKELLPTFVDKGRSQLTTQLTMARMMGEFAARQGKLEVNRRLGGLKPSVAPTVTYSAATPTRTVPTVGHNHDQSEDLAIPDYDSLAASQVVSRLTGLSPAELLAVADYETAHRGRKTILSKISQLRG